MVWKYSRNILEVKLPYCARSPVFPVSLILGSRVTASVDSNDCGLRRLFSTPCFMFMWCVYRCDTDAEVALLIELAKQAGAYDALECTHWALGGTQTLFDKSYDLLDMAKRTYKSMQVDASLQNQNLRTDL